jgi:23S rRNA pseudouridine2605 synthase
MKKKPFHKGRKKEDVRKREPEKSGGKEPEEMRLNKYVAHCGIASRRKADEFIQAGMVTVNDEIVKEPGRRVMPGDKVTFKGKPIKPEDKKVYVLLNKPKNFITTLKDEKNRRTVMDLVSHRIKERIYPVGRLDRNTTGLLLLTNDGELAQKLSHPSHQVKKVYQVVLDKPVSADHLQQIREGLELEDGKAIVDGVSHIEGGKPNEVGIDIHIGRNRIVRRIFEHLGYEVVRLDRMYYAGLTKKDLPRGRFRHLTEREVIMLKHFI